MWVKICGNMTRQDLQLVLHNGADGAGIVVEYPLPVPWNIDRLRAETLLSGLDEAKRRQCVLVTGGTPERVVRLAKLLHPGYVQLHHEEGLRDVELIVASLKPLDIRVTKALPISVESGKAYFEEDRPLHAARLLSKTGLFALLFDARSKQRPAGTGMRVSWELVREITQEISIPVILAGGLRPDNVKDAIRVTGVFGVDVTTGVEEELSRKDPMKVTMFITEAKHAETAG